MQVVQPSVVLGAGGLPAAGPARDADGMDADRLADLGMGEAGQLQRRDDVLGGGEGHGGSGGGVAEGVCDSPNQTNVDVGIGGAVPSAHFAKQMARADSVTSLGDEVIDHFSRECDQLVMRVDKPGDFLVALLKDEPAIVGMANLL